jgi:hypothetical protein
MTIVNVKDKKTWKIKIKYVHFDNQEERDKSYKLWVESYLQIKPPEDCLAKPL